MSGYTEPEFAFDDYEIGTVRGGNVQIGARGRQMHCMARGKSQKGSHKKTANAGGSGKSSGVRPAWSAEERQFLEENRETMGDREIADRLGRTKSGVRHMRNRLGLGPPKRVPVKGSWTKEMDATVLRNPDIPPEELARLLDRTTVAVMHRRRHLGLTKTRDEVSWKPHEDYVLRDNPDKPPKWLAERLKGRTVTVICKRRLTLGLPPYVVKYEWTAQEVQNLKDNLQAPMGKLVKMFPDKSESAIRGAARRLGRKRIIRKGHSIVNGYVTRYKDGRSALDHRIVMERKIGRKLKREEVVHHINYDKMDNREENLDLLPDGEAHSDANSSFQRLLPDLLASGIVRYDEGSHTYEVARHG